MPTPERHGARWKMAMSRPLQATFSERGPLETPVRRHSTNANAPSGKLVS
jgi:hypothetical protein